MKETSSEHKNSRPSVEKPKQLTALLDSILEHANGLPISIGNICHSLAGKGYPLIIILFSIPFCFPIQIPGLSTPFGVLFIFIGIRMIFAKTPWIPSWVSKKMIAYSTLEDIIRKAKPYLIKIEGILHPRWSFLTQNSILHGFYGMIIAVLGLFLSLPLPIPFTNMMSALPLLAFGLGLIADDGFVILAALFLSALCMLYFSIIIWLSHLGLSSWALM
jgi:hypothetical protein